MVRFYEVLGFAQTYYQQKPNPYLAVQREDLNLHFFSMPGYEPKDSYSTCLVLVDDTVALYRSFAAAMRVAYGKVLISGIPRVTRPRARKNAEGHSGFSVIDPGGNWIRFMAKQRPAEREATPPGKLGEALRNAVVMGDSHGLDDRAARILDEALARLGDEASPAELFETLAYRAELAVRLDDRAAAVEAIVRARSIELGDAERGRLADAFATLDDLEA
jgi:hypothetical protein